MRYIFSSSLIFPSFKCIHVFLLAETRSRREHRDYTGPYFVVRSIEYFLVAYCPCFGFSFTPLHFVIKLCEAIILSSGSCMPCGASPKNLIICLVFRFSLLVHLNALKTSHPHYLPMMHCNSGQLAHSLKYTKNCTRNALNPLRMIKLLKVDKFRQIVCDPVRRSHFP